MTFKPWSKDFNPRIEGESIADWLRREVDARTKHGGPTRSITITPREARQLLALIDAPSAGLVITDAGYEAIAEAQAQGGVA